MRSCRAAALIRAFAQTTAFSAVALAVPHVGIRCVEDVTTLTRSPAALVEVPQVLRERGRHESSSALLVVTAHQSHVTAVAAVAFAVGAPSVLSAVGMSLRTDGFPRIHGREARASQVVFADSDCLEMRGVYATPISAQMIDVAIVRDVVNKKDVRHAMRVGLLAPVKDAGIAVWADPLRPFDARFSRQARTQPRNKSLGDHRSNIGVAHA